MTESIKTICEAYKGKKINLVLGDMFELGDTSDKYHKELGGFLAGLSVSGIFLIGDKMRNVKEVLAGKKVFHTNDSQELISEIEKINFDDDTVILFKGSRGMKLDKVYGSFAATP
jgi:UDP-N-acetylmuramoyl-tripeptide--D-alanyl-D-alanine ligase